MKHIVALKNKINHQVITANKGRISEENFQRFIHIISQCEYVSIKLLQDSPTLLILSQHQTVANFSEKSSQAPV